MSDLLDEAHEFLLCMDKMEYADALFALRAELTEARLQLKEASEQEPVGESTAHFDADIFCTLPVGTKLYTRAPVPQPAVPEAVAKDAEVKPVVIMLPGECPCCQRY